MPQVDSHDARDLAVRRRVRRLGVVVLLGVVSLIVYAATRVMRQPTLADAEAALQRGALDEARRIAELHLKRGDADPTAALLIGGRAAQARGQYSAALGFFSRVADDGSPASIEALQAGGEMCLPLGRLSEAEERFRRVLVRDPRRLEAHQRLVELLRLEGRGWEALPHALELFRQRRFTVESLETVGMLDASWIDSDRDVPYLVHCNEQQPDDPLTQLGLIRMLLSRRFEVGTSRGELTVMVAMHPELIEAQAMLGQLLWELNEQDEFRAWHARLPTAAEDHPGVWVTRGQWAHALGDTRGAVRCLGEALQRYPHERAAHLLLARHLTSLGLTDDAILIQQRGHDLLEFDDLLLRGEKADGRRTPETLANMIAALEQLGRRWEALGWSHILLEQVSGSPDARAAIDRLESQLASDATGTPADFQPAAAIDWSSYPLPDWADRVASAVPPGKVAAASSIAFHDAARDTGLDFLYFVDRQRMKSRVYTFDFAGGGIGVLDFDRDGWPDLSLTQSRRWPATDSAQEPRDALFRNRDGARFDNVADQAGVGDLGFGHGTAVGDFNQDGFPDLYVANIGANSLYLNQGDGTFANRTDESQTGGDDFSLSAACADFNSDGLPDLYVANYLGGDALTKQCNADGKLIQCPPTAFPGQQDRLYVNLGDGRFRDVTDESGVLQADGKCMGVLAADVNGDRRLDLFVTNDTRENLLFLNCGELGAKSIWFQEQGALAGVAFDPRGRPQGSMGIAATDVNRDGLLDLYVTNFISEFNNLLLQLTPQPDPLFDDRAADAGLALPSLDMVGWGTQFLDADLDGDEDLFVANGNLDDNTAGAGPRAMLPQFFENDGAARFTVPPAARIGPYFSRLVFGRAVARLDWNRDGRIDLCVTHMGAPVALLTNRSLPHGHWLAIELRGVTCDREAVGTVVEVTTPDQRWTAQLVAGDGFEASNQRQLLLGLGAHERVDQLTIRWPTGLVQNFQDLASDREWLFIEGLASPYSVALPSPGLPAP